MNSTERVRNVLLGKPVDRQPITGWPEENLREQISQVYGSVSAFEDKYEFDAAHIFCGPHRYKGDLIRKIREENGVVTPLDLLDVDYFAPVDDPAAYQRIKDAIVFHKERERFCYVLTAGFFETMNSEIFGIENQLMYLAMYPDEIAELYRRQLEWNKACVTRCVEAGADMIFVGDDWGAQNNMMFSPAMWKEYIYPNMKELVDHIHSLGVFAGLHSDGHVMPVVDSLKEIGLDMLHPWQESAGMSYDVYLDKYADSITILGGICVQTALGVMSREQLEQDIRRVFGKLKGKRWICCTTHYVQAHCSIEDLAFAYDLIYKLARE